MLFVIGFFGSIINGIEFAAAEPSTNKVKIITDSMYMDVCNEYNTGTNSAVCSELDSTTTESIV